MRCVDPASVLVKRLPVKEINMGMGISSVGSGGGASQAGAAAWQQRQQSFQALAHALKSNDLAAAKTAYASLTGNGSNSAASNANSPLAQLGQALQNGDLGAAQQAFSALRSGHHHHGGGAVSATAAAGSTTSTSSGTASLLASTAPTPPNPTLTSGNTVNVYV
jgi:hypothetical protein